MAAGFSDGFESGFRMMAAAKDAKARRRLQEEMAQWKKGLMEDEHSESDLRRKLLERRLEQEMQREKERKMRLMAGMAGEFAGKTGLGGFARGLGDAFSRAGQVAQGQRIGRAMASQRLPQQQDPMDALALEEKQLKVEQLRRQMAAEEEAANPLAGMPSTDELAQQGDMEHLARLDDMITKDQAALAKGDEQAGFWQFLGLGTKRDERLERNMEKRRELESKLRGQPQPERSTDLKPGRVIVQNGKQYEFLGGDPSDPQNYKEL